MTSSNDEYRIEIPIEVADKTDAGTASVIATMDKIMQRLEKLDESVKKGVGGDAGKKPKIEVEDKSTPVLSGILKMFGGLAEGAGNMGLKMVEAFSSPARALGTVTGGLNSMFNTMTNIKFLLLGGGTLGAFVGWPISLAENLTKAQIGFEHLLGSQEAATKFMGDIQKFAIETPFETTQLVNTSRFLLTQNFKPEEVIPHIQAVGDVVAAYGLAADRIDSLSNELARLRLEGRATSGAVQEMGFSGVNAWKYLAEAAGTTEQRMRMRAQTSGMLPFTGQRAYDVIMEGMRRDTGGAMVQTANMTLGGIWNQIWDSFTINVMTKWGKGIQGGMLPVAQDILSVIDLNQNAMVEWGDSLQDFGHRASAAISGAFGGAVERVTGMLKSKEFRDADFGGKLQISWKKLIEEPFGKWWDSTGEKFFMDVAEKMGSFLGGTVSGIVEALAGIDQDKTGENKNRFIQAGVRIGQAFAEGIGKGVDVEKLVKSIAEGVWKAAPSFIPMLPQFSTPGGGDALRALQGKSIPRPEDSPVAKATADFLNEKPFTDRLNEWLGNLGEWLGSHMPSQTLSGSPYFQGSSYGAPRMSQFQMASMIWGMFPALQAPYNRSQPQSVSNNGPVGGTTGGTSGTAGNGAGLPSINRSEVVKRLLPDAIRASKETGIPVDVLLAIPLSEVDWSKGNPGNNLYGIKADDSWKGKTNTFDTWEMINGQRVNTKAKFRAYDSPYDSMLDFAGFLNGNSRYKPAMTGLRNGGTGEDFVHGINQAGYATNPDWWKTIIELMKFVRGVMDQTPPGARTNASVRTAGVGPITINNDFSGITNLDKANIDHVSRQIADQIGDYLGANMESISDNMANAKVV